MSHYKEFVAEIEVYLVNSLKLITHVENGVSQRTAAKHAELSVCLLPDHVRAVPGEGNGRLLEMLKINGVSLKATLRELFDAYAKELLSMLSSSRKERVREAALKPNPMDTMHTRIAEAAEDISKQKERSYKARLCEQKADIARLDGLLTQSQELVSELKAEIQGLVAKAKQDGRSKGAANAVVSADVLQQGNLEKYSTTPASVVALSKFCQKNPQGTLFIVAAVPQFFNVVREEPELLLHSAWLQQLLCKTVTQSFKRNQGLSLQFHAGGAFLALFPSAVLAAEFAFVTNSLLSSSSVLYPEVLLSYPAFNSGLKLHCGVHCVPVGRVSVDKESQCGYGREVCRAISLVSLTRGAEVLCSAAVYGCRYHEEGGTEPHLASIVSFVDVANTVVHFNQPTADHVYQMLYTAGPPPPPPPPPVPVEEVAESSRGAKRSSVASVSSQNSNVSEEGRKKVEVWAMQALTAEEEEEKRRTHALATHPIEVQENHEEYADGVLHSFCRSWAIDLTGRFAIPPVTVPKTDGAVLALTIGAVQPAVIAYEGENVLCPSTLRAIVSTLLCQARESCSQAAGIEVVNPHRTQVDSSFEVFFVFPTARHAVLASLHLIEKMAGDERSQPIWPNEVRSVVPLLTDPYCIQPSIGIYAGSLSYQVVKEVGKKPVKEEETVANRYDTPPQRHPGVGGALQAALGKQLVLLQGKCRDVSRGRSKISRGGEAVISAAVFAELDSSSVLSQLDPSFRVFGDNASEPNDTTLLSVVPKRLEKLQQNARPMKEAKLKYRIPDPTLPSACGLSGTSADSSPKGAIEAPLPVSSAEFLCVLRPYALAEITHFSVEVANRCVTLFNSAVLASFAEQGAQCTLIDHREDEGAFLFQCADPTMCLLAVFLLQRKLLNVVWPNDVYSLPCGEQIADLHKGVRLVSSIGVVNEDPNKTTSSTAALKAAVNVLLDLNRISFANDVKVTPLTRTLLLAKKSAFGVNAPIWEGDPAMRCGTAYWSVYQHCFVQRRELERACAQRHNAAHQPPSPPPPPEHEPSHPTELLPKRRYPAPDGITHSMTIPSEDVTALFHTIRTLATPIAQKESQIPWKHMSLEDFYACSGREPKAIRVKERRAKELEEELERMECVVKGDVKEGGDVPPPQEQQSLTMALRFVNATHHSAAFEVPGLGTPWGASVVVAVPSFDDEIAQAEHAPIRDLVLSAQTHFEAQLTQIGVQENAHLATLPPEDVEFFVLNMRKLKVSRADFRALRLAYEITCHVVVAEKRPGGGAGNPAFIGRVPCFSVAKHLAILGVIPPAVFLRALSKRFSFSELITLWWDLSSHDSKWLVLRLGAPFKHGAMHIKRRSKEVSDSDSDSDSFEDLGNGEEHITPHYTSLLGVTAVPPPPEFVAMVEGEADGLVQIHDVAQMLAYGRTDATETPGEGGVPQKSQTASMGSRSAPERQYAVKAAVAAKKHYHNEKRRKEQERTAALRTLEEEEQRRVERRQRDEEMRKERQTQRAESITTTETKSAEKNALSAKTEYLQLGQSHKLLRSLVDMLTMFFAQLQERKERRSNDTSAALLYLCLRFVDLVRDTQASPPLDLDLETLGSEPGHMPRPDGVPQLSPLDRSMDFFVNVSDPRDRRAGASEGSSNAAASLKKRLDTRMAELKGLVSQTFVLDLQAIQESGKHKAKYLTPSTMSGSMVGAMCCLLDTLSANVPQLVATRKEPKEDTTTTTTTELKENEPSRNPVANGLNLKGMKRAAMQAVRNEGNTKRLIDEEQRERTAVSDRALSFFRGVARVYKDALQPLHQLCFELQVSNQENERRIDEVEATLGSKATEAVVRKLRSRDRACQTATMTAKFNPRPKSPEALSQPSSPRATPPPSEAPKTEVKVEKEKEKEKEDKEKEKEKQSGSDKKEAMLAKAKAAADAGSALGALSGMGGLLAKTSAKVKVNVNASQEVASPTPMLELSPTAGLEAPSSVSCNSARSFTALTVSGEARTKSFQRIRELETQLAYRDSEVLALHSMLQSGVRSVTPPPETPPPPSPTSRWRAAAGRIPTNTSSQTDDVSPPPPPLCTIDVSCPRCLSNLAIEVDRSASTGQVLPLREVEGEGLRGVGPRGVLRARNVVPELQLADPVQYMGQPVSILTGSEGSVPLSRGMLRDWFDAQMHVAEGVPVVSMKGLVPLSPGVDEGKVEKKLRTARLHKKTVDELVSSLLDTADESVRAKTTLPLSSCADATHAYQIESMELGMLCPQSVEVEGGTKKARGRDKLAQQRQRGLLNKGKAMRALDAVYKEAVRGTCVPMHTSPRPRCDVTPCPQEKLEPDLTRLMSPITIATASIRDPAGIGDEDVEY